MKDIHPKDRLRPFVHAPHLPEDLPDPGGIPEPSALKPPLRDWYWQDKIHEQLASS